MTFFALVLKNLVRQRVRTALTVLGISVGITTVVALGVVLAGVRQTASAVLRAYDSDFMVAQKGSSDLSFSIVTEDEVEALRQRDDVAGAVGVLFHISRVGGNPYFVLIGIDPRDISGQGPQVIEGRRIRPGAAGEAMIGSRAASDLGLRVGDTLETEERDFTVVGIYKANNIWEDSGAYAPLDVVQEIAGKPDAVTAVYIKVAEGEDPAVVAHRIEQDHPGLTSVASVDEYSEVDQGIEILDAMNIAISALAVGIGAIGVMNTMIMSVFERTREIGILRAVGWRGSRIVRMILGESLLLCGIAAVVGSALGVLASRLVLVIPTVRSLLEPQYEPQVFVRALVVALVVGVVGAIYPVIRAVRLTPMEALRHE